MTGSPKVSSLNRYFIKPILFHTSKFLIIFQLKVKMLANYFKNLKTISFLRNQVSCCPEQTPKLTYLFGNQSNDPDSVFGCVAMSLLLFISHNKENLGFHKIFDSVLSSVELDVCEFLADPTNSYEIFIPVLNS